MITLILNIVSMTFAACVILDSIMQRSDKALKRLARGTASEQLETTQRGGDSAAHF